MAPCEPSPIEPALDIVAGKWKIYVLWTLVGGPLRYSALLGRVRGVSDKVLIQQLKALCSDGLVERTLYAEMPLRVEYALAPLGRSLVPILDALCAWSEQHLGVTCDAPPTAHGAP